MMERSSADNVRRFDVRSVLDKSESRVCAECAGNVKKSGSTPAFGVHVVEHLGSELRLKAAWRVAVVARVWHPLAKRFGEPLDILIAELDFVHIVNGLGHDCAWKVLGFGCSGGVGKVLVWLSG